MDVISAPPRTALPVSVVSPDARLPVRIERVLASSAMAGVRALLEPLGSRIEREPLVHKYLTSPYLRLVFPVSDGVIQAGTVVSIVCLYDCSREATLYAHAMHAGPQVNPLLLHLDGPMASPKAQPGRDGDRATVRLMAQKEALWRRFLAERDKMGSEAASARWRTAYYWALVRLYFCNRCSSCRWGSPFFEGPDPDAPPMLATIPLPRAAATLSPAEAEIVAAVTSSEAWKAERAYVARGGFALSETPRIVRRADASVVQLIFPTNALLIQGGSIVAVWAVYSRARREVLFVSALSAGPQPEIQFMRGVEALGLPPPCASPARARARYRRWRREAWHRFWLDDLEAGIAVASDRWMRGFWRALEGLFGCDDGTLADASCSASTGAADAADRINATAESEADSGPVGPPFVRPSRRSATAGAVRPAAIPLETLQNTGRRCFVGHATEGERPSLHARGVKSFVVNLGRRCNQVCTHCYIDAGPNRTEEMSRETMDLVIDAARRHKIAAIDITGGAPELHSHFRYFVEKARSVCVRVIDRCNLTILLEPGQDDLARFLAEHQVEIAASFPHTEAELVDGQRGQGVFDRSIAALRLLNGLGYGRPGTQRILNLVSNPPDTELAAPQREWEARVRRALGERHGVVFNNLFAMNNMPVNRFHDRLDRNGRLESYLNRLLGAFNPSATPGLTCRHSLTIKWDGTLHDCDFNQAADVPLSDGLPSRIEDFDGPILATRAVNTRAHCFGCTAGAGSSCYGALSAEVFPSEAE